jgi:tyrosyl-tRNA synthetase
MILQAMDFYVLHKERGVDMQVAGQDQWGNITAGIELARKKDGSELLGFTMPLLTKSDGTKFGKSEGKAIWLDREKTSPYEMYQFFINSEDEKVIDYLKFLTFLSKEEIEALEESHKKEPHKREAHKALAKEVITFLHGEEAYEEAVAISQMLFSGQIKDLTYDQVKECFNGVPTVEVDEDLMILNALVKVGAASSNREARQFVKGGSVMVNGEKVTDEKFVVAKANAYGEKATVIRRGKKKYFVINHK